jgi:hypothetical protein
MDSVTAGFSFTFIQANIAAQLAAAESRDGTAVAVNVALQSNSAGNNGGDD